jgi:hypothetical protein
MWTLTSKLSQEAPARPGSNEVSGIFGAESDVVSGEAWLAKSFHQDVIS